MINSIPLLLFAKAPIPGKVKTRLQSHCSDQQAAQIAELLLDESLRKTTNAWPGEVLLSVWLDENHPSIRRLCDRYQVRLVKQCQGDLGAKMQGAFEEHGFPLAIMGCDAPHIASHTLVAMHELLLNGKDALGPSLDGGYYIVGLSKPWAELFDDMPWGTDQVLPQTRARASSGNRKLTELPELNDVDEWQDVLDVKKILPTLQRYLSAQGLV